MGYWGYYGSKGELPVHGCSCSPVEQKGGGRGGGAGVQGEKVIGRESKREREGKNKE